MNQKSNNYLYNFAIYILLPFAIVKLLWSVGLFFLDKDALNAQKEGDFIYHYNINLAKNIIGSSKATESTKQVETHNRVDDIKLKGTYASEAESFIVIEDNLGTTFLYLTEKYVGYKLIEVYDDRAVLEKNGVKYDIVLEDSDDRPSTGRSSKASSQSSEQEQEPVEFVPGEPVELTRAELNTYVKNPNKIWKNIRIQELRKDGTLNGFRVNYVKKGSFFERAGLKSGDVIKGIDGKEIKSLSDVMKYYSNVETLDGLSLSVSRGEEELNLEFNVN
ncbi:MAG TPA: PDZ domain-containing protein [Campylobacterales bacterium]|nr:PDZ domain-containing protein [Campylobacterales bacterium]HIP60193.1 PDZ domain-containing protein [Campylobacterales bacterium]